MASPFIRIPELCIIRLHISPMELRRLPRPVVMIVIADRMSGEVAEVVAIENTIYVDVEVMAGRGSMVAPTTMADLRVVKTSKFIMAKTNRSRKPHLLARRRSVRSTLWG